MDYAQVCEAITAAHLSVGHIDMLVCCAGTSLPGRFLEQDLSVFRRTMDLNYHGTVHAVKAVLPHMVAAHAGHLVLVASAAAVCDSLRNELLASGVWVSVAYPPDTDTPGYAAEQKTKPPECHALSRAAGDVLYSPEQVARCMVHGIEAGAYHLPSPDFGHNVMVAASAGLTPRRYPVALECLLAPLVAKLDAAAEDLRSSAKNCTVHTFAADVMDYAQVCEAITAAHLSVGHIDMLVCCEGTSPPGRFLEQDLSVFRRTMDLNYHGTVHAVKAVLPHMVAAHSLRNELLASGVRVSVAYPPDTDTPGYTAEQQTKPPECHAVSRAAGDVLYSPEQVARCMVHGIEAGAYHLPSPNFGHNVMVAASAGLTPRRLLNRSNQSVAAAPRLRTKRLLICHIKMMRQQRQLHELGRGAAGRA
ncbi:hypothetical protein WJX81_005235 [Elliptochloris bilobata]|uniref:Uncharacterized protein n=1 Tax=Elliptochloris bilobata TaxID=381761 RepID=A0AAW1QTN9_9CHLO